MNQLPLINTAMMSSTRSIAKLAKARALATYNSARISAGKSIAPSAADRENTPIKSPEGLPENRRNFLSGPGIEDGECEFSMPDESRDFRLDRFYCRICHRGIALHRDLQRGKMHYMVGCITQSCTENDTPWLPSSQEAVAAWKLADKLSRL